MNSRRQFFAGAGTVAATVAAGAVSRVALAALPEPVLQARADTRYHRWYQTVAGLQPSGDAERLDVALADEQRGEGIPSRRRAGLYGRWRRE